MVVSAVMKPTYRQVHQVSDFSEVCAWGQIGRPKDEPTPFFIDSQSTDDLALNPVFHKMLKHIELKRHCFGPSTTRTTYFIHFASTL